MDIANSRGRTAGHVLLGLVITGGAVMTSALIAARHSPSPSHPEVKAQYDQLTQTPLQPPAVVFGVVWPALFMALTLSGLRIWNAPKSLERTRALTLWGLIQAFNAMWMALGPRRLGGQLATAVATLGTAAAYAWEARKVDAPASNLAAPYLGWIGFANVLTEELWRKNGSRPTIH
ncbi:MAG: TspO/MBR family protein [Caulobacteraceae bacterium]